MRSLAKHIGIVASVACTSFAAFAQTPVAPEVIVAAKGAGLVPGAIICPDYRTTTYLFSLYSAAKQDQMIDKLTHGESTLERGPASGLPDMSLYHCAMVDPGTPMLLEPKHAFPVVTVTLSNGSRLRGVTLPSMVGQ